MPCTVSAFENWSGPENSGIPELFGRAADPVEMVHQDLILGE